MIELDTKCAPEKSCNGGEAMTPQTYPLGYFNEDCLVGMKRYPDKYFDLAIVDPPFGDAGTGAFDKNRRGRFGGKFDKYEINPNKKGEKTWDIAPSKEYFDELFRVSKNQIIWGGNYFWLPPTRCFLVWRKPTVSESFSMAMCEYAWTSFNGNAKWIEIVPMGTSEPRIHPTEKPIKLYNWILANYAKQGDIILDTHVGSANSLIACHFGGFDYVGFEIDKNYYEQSKKRLDIKKMQVSMFAKD